MDEPKPGPSTVPEHVPKQDTVNAEEDGPIPFADSPESSPPKFDIRKASIAAQQQLHDGIILLITSDTESQRSPNGSIAQHPLSEFYLLPLPQDALSTNRRYSLQDRGREHHIHNERKASCPDTELRLSPDRSRRGSTCSNRKSDLDLSNNRLTPTSFSTSRRSSTADVYHSTSRRSSTCSMAGAGHHRRRSSNCTNCSRRSSNSSVSHSRRSSTASHRSSPSHGSRRSSNCSRRSSHFDSDEETYLHPHHHHCHRGSRSSLDPIRHGSFDRRASHMPSPQKKDDEEMDEREELELGGIPMRHRRIIIMIIGSVSIFILVMSVVLIAVSLTLSPTIDDLGKSIIFYKLIRKLCKYIDKYEI